jgi:hypothetical protein
VSNLLPGVWVAVGVDAAGTRVRGEEAARERYGDVMPRAGTMHGRLEVDPGQGA